jgi:GT2 family glycosyltransferase
VSDLPTLSISIVTYRPEAEVLQATIQSLSVALERAFHSQVAQTGAVMLVDNGPGTASKELLHRLTKSENLRWLAPSMLILSGHGNVGYGRGHNLALRRTNSDFHLVLNPDVILSQSAIVQAIGFLRAHPDVGLLAPETKGPDGAIQYLCKRYPSVVDLLLRGFAPQSVKRRFARRLARYEMHDIVDNATVFDVPIVSGCFMLFRRGVLERIGGFCEDYFLYFEDFDLSLRTGKASRIAYVKDVKIVHFGGDAARKGWRHVLMFARSGIRFFNKHGWKFV